MKKLKNILNSIYDGKLPKGMGNISLYDIRELQRIYDAKLRKENPSFINGYVKEILDACGIKTKEKGIGWMCV